MKPALLKPLPEPDHVYLDRQAHRRAMGHLWVMCSDCGSKLYDADGSGREEADLSRPCPYKMKTGRCDP